MFLKEFKEEEEELEGTDPEAFEFRRCAQESPPDDVKEDDDAMMMKTL